MVRFVIARRRNDYEAICFTGWLRLIIKTSDCFVPRDGKIFFKMNFLSRFLVVIVWLMGISASAFAVTKRCAKNEKTILPHTIKTSQRSNHTSSSASDKSKASCTGSMCLYCIKNGETVTFP